MVILTSPFSPPTFQVGLTDAIGTTGKIPYGSARGGVIHLPDAGASHTSLTFWVSHDGTTFVPLYDSSNAAVARTVEKDRAYAFPDECFGAAFVKIVSDASGNVEVTLKG